MPDVLWTYRHAAPPGGIALARESGHVLIWDHARWLVLLNRQGRLQAQRRLDAGIAGAAIAEDASAVADVDDRGIVVWRTPDLAPRWRHPLNRRPTALAMDALGRAL